VDPPVIEYVDPRIFALFVLIIVAIRRLFAEKRRNVPVSFGYGTIHEAQRVIV